MQPRRVRVTDIERLQRTLDNQPERRIEEVSTVEAIRMLSSQIRAMQSKGYALGAIADLLSENGVTVTVGTLKSYLKQVKTAGEKGQAARHDAAAN